MATKVSAILDIAYAKSNRNVPATDAVELAEYLPLVHRSMSALFAVGARVNPMFFADEDDVAYAAPGWARPAAAESVFRIEKADGTKVIVVPRSQPLAEKYEPSVYALGQVYRIANDASGSLTIADTLTFLYAKVPDTPSAMTSDLDTLWPDHYNELLGLELAIHMALKDSGPRLEEIAPLRDARDAWLRRFIMFLEHETVGGRVSYGLEETFRAPSIVPLSSIMAGGSSVSLGGG